IKKGYLDGIVNRVCLQALNYPGVFNHLNTIVRSIKYFSAIPISVSCQPDNLENILQLANFGVDRIGIPIDAATKRLFTNIKGKNVGNPFTWKNQFNKLRSAVKIFGEGNVSTHLIIGLGESEKEVLALIQNLRNLGILSALFAFTPIRGTKLENFDKPSIDSYRRIQLAKYLIDKGLVSFNKLGFDNLDQLVSYGTDKSILCKIVESGAPFRTSGCPDCNRPFYNERPSGPLFNFPRSLKEIEIVQIKQLLCLE
ncbi:radical SAM protein, partial [Candidatus Bathyarchaeota archaeon]|nr:radical SAM protein [Candidatus Bathyarchaeota archaeon]